MQLLGCWPCQLSPNPAEVFGWYCGLKAWSKDHQCKWKASQWFHWAFNKAPDAAAASFSTLGKESSCCWVDCPNHWANSYMETTPSLPPPAAVLWMAETVPNLWIVSSQRRLQFSLNKLFIWKVLPSFSQDHCCWRTRRKEPNLTQFSGWFCRAHKSFYL